MWEGSLLPSSHFFPSEKKLCPSLIENLLMRPWGLLGVISLSAWLLGSQGKSWAGGLLFPCLGARGLSPALGVSWGLSALRYLPPCRRVWVGLCNGCTSAMPFPFCWEGVFSHAEAGWGPGHGLCSVNLSPSSRLSVSSFLCLFDAHTQSPLATLPSPSLSLPLHPWVCGCGEPHSSTSLISNFGIKKALKAECHKTEINSSGSETWRELTGSYSVADFIYPNWCDCPGIIPTEILIYLITGCAL